MAARSIRAFGASQLEAKFKQAGLHLSGKRVAEGTEQHSQIVLEGCKMKSLTPFLLMLTFGIGGFAYQANTESELRHRIELYYSYFSAGQYERMWEMTSKQERKSVTKKQYIQNVRLFGKPLMKVQVRHIDLKNSQANASLILCVKSRSDESWTEVEMEEAWVFEDDNWRFINFHEGDNRTGCSIDK